MRSLEDILRATIVALACLAVAWSQDSVSAKISGHVQSGETTTSLIARLYSPKGSDTQGQQNTKQAGGDVRHVMVAYIGQDGTFDFHGLRPGSYLLEIYVGDHLLYQKVVSTQDTQPLEIVLSTTPGNSNSSLFKMVPPSTACDAVGEPVEIYERNYIRLADYRFHDEVYIYVGDIHRFGTHKTGKDNWIYVMIGPNLLLDAGNPRTSGKLSDAVLANLRSKALLFEEGVFDRSGLALPFEYQGARYRLVIKDIHNRFGAGTESVTIAICR